MIHSEEDEQERKARKYAEESRILEENNSNSIEDFDLEEDEDGDEDWSDEEEDQYWDNINEES